MQLYLDFRWFDFNQKAAIISGFLVMTINLWAIVYQLWTMDHQLWTKLKLKTRRYFYYVVEGIEITIIIDGIQTIIVASTQVKAISKAVTYATY